MKTYHTKLNINPSYPLMYPYTWEDIIFFDIETTGFSAKTSYLYLIGCLFYKDNTWQMTQWLADDISSEVTIIEAFFNTIKSYKRLIHFNGSGFDIPFILQKCKQHSIDNSLGLIESYDIYKKIIPFKKILPLPNYKLKTIEEFAGIKRKDIFTGEDLIQIYANYLGRLQYEKLLKKSNPDFSVPSKTNIYDSISGIDKDNTKNLSSEELSRLILLHNFEDVTGLVQIADILYYPDIFYKEPSDFLTLLEKNADENMVQSIMADSTKFTRFSVLFQLPFLLLKPVTLITPLTGLLSVPLPAFLSDSPKGNNLIHSDLFLKLILDGDRLTVELPVYDGELKYFYDNYRDYYYLPKEDTAIHKSVAQYVDNEYKIKAKPGNCYTKKSSSFLPQTDNLFTPYFKKENTDKITYFEITNEKFQNDSCLFEYMKSILHYIIGCKETKSIN